VKLTHLDLSGNALEGSIPEHLFNMSNLKSLDLHRNNLNGTLSNRVKDLVNLESLVRDMNANCSIT
jgi:Leucine-rich repeat (LRR) protein